MPPKPFGGETRRTTNEMRVMRVCLVAIGSTGDVVPFLGAGKYLATQGYSVMVATHGSFEASVADLGLSYAPLPMEPRSEFTEERAALMRRSPLQAAKVVTEVFAPFVRDLAWAIDKAADNADVLLLSALGWTGIHSAEARGIPSIGLHLQPLEPTREFPPPAVSARDLGGVGNRAVGRLLQRRMVAPYMTVVNEIRRTHSLPPTSTSAHLHKLIATDWPILVGISKQLVATPSDWRPGVRNVGFWEPPPLSSWTPDDELVSFVQSGPAPVYIGFGSTGPAPAERLAQIVREATELAQVRAVVATGWSGMDISTDDRIFAVESVDHSWLFPRVRAAVHHAGSGTTAAAVRNGVVSVPVPLGMDQPFFARRLFERSLATRPIPARELSAKRLADALTEAVSANSLLDSARRVAQQVRSEDALAAVVGQLQRTVEVGRRARGSSA